MKRKYHNHISNNIKSEYGNIQALAINHQDNVATAIVDLTTDTSAIIQFPDGKRNIISISENIPKYHKFALCDIQYKEYIIKYGHIIGQSKQEIKKGKHIHLHNMVSGQEIKKDE